MPDPAERVLERLRALVAEFDPEERAVLATLLAPGVALAYTERKEEGEVTAFDGSSPDATLGDVGWTAERLPSYLTAAIRRRELRIVEE